MFFVHKMYDGGYSALMYAHTVPTQKKRTICYGPFLNNLQPMREQVPIYERVLFGKRKSKNNVKLWFLSAKTFVGGH